MNEILSCPNCNSNDINIQSNDRSFDTHILRDENRKMAMEIQSPDIFKASCNDCHSDLKLTIDGIRLSK